MLCRQVSALSVDKRPSLVSLFHVSHSVLSVDDFSLKKAFETAEVSLWEEVKWVLRPEGTVDLIE